MLNPILFSASKNVDNLCYHESMKNPDVREFQKAIINEFNAQIKLNHW